MLFPIDPLHLSVIRSGGILTLPGATLHLHSWRPWLISARPVIRLAAVVWCRPSWRGLRLVRALQPLPPCPSKADRSAWLCRGRRLYGQASPEGNFSFSASVP